MNTYFNLLRRQGLHLWLSFLLGSIATQVILSIAFIFIGVLGVMTIGFAYASDFEEIFNNSDLRLTIDALVNFLVSTPSFIITIIIFILVLSAISLIPSSFLKAGMYGLVNKTVNGEKANINTFFAQGIKWVWHMVLQGLLIFLLYLPLFLFSLVPIFLIIGGAIAAPILLFLMIFFIQLMMWIGLMHAPIMMIAEDVSPWTAIKGSFSLFFRSMGKVFGSVLSVIGISVLFMLPLLIITVVLSILLSTSSEEAMGIGNLLIQMISMLYQYTVIPFMQVMTTLAIVLRYKLYLTKS
ncbi:hypothetical protein [Mechercharimyces sp. CAU 1602]|uniref:hypothetical protein n=1 Tax=Mechercharimyces sp. CAU 1602 TaxID=2973933 RepID=UPI002161E5BD|nr:hypothetical protein [Mechercharimyces sp. CAU 1602]MCS1351530.1 hypothetical protein [Mechercharimyces sp. CAU 1602]